MLPESLAICKGNSPFTDVFHLECVAKNVLKHYDDVIMSAIASQITSLTIVYSTVYPSADQSKHQSSASLAFVWGIHRRPVNSPHKWPVTRKMFPFDDIIMNLTLVLTNMVVLSYLHGLYQAQWRNFISNTQMIQHSSFSVLLYWKLKNILREFKASFDLGYTW